MEPSKLAIVIYDREGYVSSIQRSILRGFGCSNHSAAENEKALLHELVIGRDLVLLNWEDNWDALLAMIKVLRDPATSPDPMVGIVVISSMLDVTRASAALNAGANSLIRSPFTAADVQKHVNHVTGAPWRFIRAAGYFGPDRRRRAGASPEGGERRQEQCEVLEGEALAKERARLRSVALAAFESMVATQSNVA